VLGPEAQGLLRDFFREGAPLAQPGPGLDVLAGLEGPDRERLRNRCTILGRHLFPLGAADARVEALLRASGGGPVGPGPAGPLPAGAGAAGLAWAEDFAGAPPAPGAALAREFLRQPPPYFQGAPGGPRAGEDWALEHAHQAQVRALGQQQYQQPQVQAEALGSEASPSVWADEFETQGASERPAEVAGLAAQPAGTSSPALLQHTRAIEEELTGSADPRMRNSQFMRFVQRLNRGELAVEGDRLVGGEGEEAAAPAQAAAGGQGAAWASEFAGGRAAEPRAADRVGADWSREFAETVAGGLGDSWAEQYRSAGPVGEAGAQPSVVDEWVESYLEENPWARDSVGPQSRPGYEFQANNPFDSHADPMAVGVELVGQGLLSEAVLAFEAAAKRDPGNADAWYRLGLVHAENDEDGRAIAAMDRAHAADPNNRDVLLSLGVSHTNELEAPEAVGYLQAWLSSHPAHQGVGDAVAGAGPLSAATGAPALDIERVVAQFEAAAARTPGDADLQVALGVLNNLTRNYDRAVLAFKQALQARGGDPSLWNKLGATQANSSQSSAAVEAYQRALSLKPNYVRAWANMGISYANQGQYGEALRYYTRAVQLNPQGDGAWGYLRMALTCAGRQDLLPLVSNRDAQALEQHFPL